MLGSVLGWMFALFAVLASFGIGNLTQANSISTALKSTFGVPYAVTGIIITILALLIIIGGIKSISKISQVVVPLMAVFYIIAGMVVIIGNISNVPSGVAMIFKMAFSVKAVGGGLCGGIVASMMQALRFGVARGVFSNEAGMGSAAITAAAASTNDPVRQGYINMTGTFWDTIVVCTITGLCIASSGVLGTTDTTATGNYAYTEEASGKSSVSITSKEEDITKTTLYSAELTSKDNKAILELENLEDNKEILLSKNADNAAGTITGTWTDTAGNEYIFSDDFSYEYKELTEGSALTIKAFETILGSAGGWLVCIGITLFAFSTILGWEYHGEKAFEYIFGTHKFNIFYRIFFSLIAYVGATTTLEIAWKFSDIANALMAIPNLICLLALSGVIAEEIERFQKVIKVEKK